jgi:hypothetical protein
MTRNIRYCRYCNRQTTHARNSTHGCVAIIAILVFFQLGFIFWPLFLFIPAFLIVEHLRPWICETCGNSPIAVVPVSVVDPVSIIPPGRTLPPSRTIFKGIPIENETFVVECPGCDAEYEIEPEWAGREVTCEDCDTSFTLPRAD